MKTRALAAVFLLPAFANGALLTGQAVVASRDKSGIVVWLEPADGSAAPASGGTGGSMPIAKVIQKKQVFLPRVQAVQVGTAVDFPNLDPMFHNVFSDYDGQVFDLHLYAPQTSRRVVFRRPGMAYVFCNIHETMSAVIAVLPTPYFAVTAADGRFEIRAPAGAYRLQIWHERSLPETLEGLRRQLTLGENGQDLGQIRISEDGYVARPHKNKYGQDYAPPPDETFFYPGGRR